MSRTVIAIYGATGFTGQLIAEEVASTEHRLVIAGRNEEKLQNQRDRLVDDGHDAPQVAVAEIDESGRLDAVFAGVDVVINCAGPFAECGKPVVRAALRTATHYLDTSGEQEHIRWVAAQCDGDARRRSVALMPACAFEFALGDLAAEIALAAAASRIVVAYAVRDFKMSHGTKKSLVRTLGNGGFTYRNGQHIEKRTGYRLFDVPFPDGSHQKGAWVPGGEAITVPRRGGVSRVETCVIATGGMAHLAAPLVGLVPGLMKLLQPIADRVVEKTSGDPDDAADDRQDFLVICFDPKTSQAHVTLRGQDPYRTTARLASEVAQRMIDEEPVQSGFVGPADLFEPRLLLEDIGVEVLST